MSSFPFYFNWIPGRQHNCFFQCKCIERKISIIAIISQKSGSKMFDKSDIMWITVVCMKPPLDVDFDHDFRFCLFQISDFSKKNVCFVMFVDEQTLSKLASDGHVLDNRGFVGLWRVVVVRNLPYKDMRRTGKVPKFLSHRIFPSSRYLSHHDLIIWFAAVGFTLLLQSKDP